MPACRSTPPGQLTRALAHALEDPRRVHDAAAEDDPLRRERADHVHEAGRDVLRLELPRAALCEFVRGSPVALPQRPSPDASPSKQSPWYGQQPGNGSRLAVVRNEHVPELGMQQAVQHLAAHDGSAADPGADR